jgi:hypothetical protein
MKIPWSIILENKPIKLGYIIRNRVTNHRLCTFTEHDMQCYKLLCLLKAADHPVLLHIVYSIALLICFILVVDKIYVSIW